MHLIMHGNVDTSFASERVDIFVNQMPYSVEQNPKFTV